MTPAPTPVSILLLGPFELRGVPASPGDARVLSPHRIGLVAYLAMTPEIVRRDTLRALFWPDRSEGDAWRDLDQAIVDLRATLGDEVVIADENQGVGLNRSRIWCDAVVFEERCRTGELTEAMQLYRGPFAFDVVVSGQPELLRWIDVTRARLRAKASSACNSLSMDFADRDARAALDWSRRAFEIEPSEAALRRLMVLHHALGDSAGAIRHYDKFARALRAERGIDPAPETQRLYNDIQRATPIDGAPRMPAPDTREVVQAPRRKTPVAAAGIFALVVIAVVLFAITRKRPADGATLTPSRAALDAYRQGEVEMHAGRFESAVERFKHAVDFDSTYAMGYFRLSEAANWTGQAGLAGEAADHAQRLAASLGARDRSRIDAWSLYLSGHADEAAKLYSGMLAADSTDADAWFYLAEIQFHWGPMFGTPTVRSASAWDRVLQLDPENAGALIHRLRIASMEFDRARFDSLAERLDQLTPSADREIEVRGLRAFSFGDAGAQRAVASSLNGTDALKKSLVREMLLGARDMKSAAQMLIPILFVRQGFQSWEQGDLMLQAQAQAATDQLPRALITIDSAAMLEPDRAIEYKAMLASIEDLPVTADFRRSVRRELDRPASPLSHYVTLHPLREYLSAILDVRLGDIAAARKDLVALQSASTPEQMAVDSTLARHVARLAKLVVAEIARAEGDLDDAVKALGAPTLEPDMRVPYVWSYPRAHERFLRGELAAAQGHAGEAMGWFETFPDPGAYDLPYLPWALRRDAELAAKAGDGKKAVAASKRADELFPPK